MERIMVDEEKDIEIVLDEAPKQPEEKRGEPIVIVEGDDESEQSAKNEFDAQKELKKLERDLKKERQARERAEQQKDMAQHEASENRKHVIAAAVHQLKNDHESLKSKWSEAMSINDFDLAAQIQSDISKNSIDLARLEAEVETSRRQETVKTQQVNQLDDIIKAVSPTSAKWLKSHRDTLNDPVMIQDMFDAHGAAVRRGIDPDTSEYFEFIEKRLGLDDEKPAPKRKQVEEQYDDEPMSAAAKPSSRQAPPPPAPVERYGSRPNVIRLSRAEVETAKSLGMTEKEYAANKMALQKEGRMNKGA
jgi:hypothetical protein